MFVTFPVKVTLRFPACCSFSMISASASREKSKRPETLPMVKALGEPTLKLLAPFFQLPDVGERASVYDVIPAPLTMLTVRRAFAYDWIPAPVGAPGPRGRASRYPRIPEPVGAVEPDLRLSKYEAEEMTTLLVEADAKLVGAAGEAGVETELAPALLREAAYEGMPDPEVVADLGRASK